MPLENPDLAIPARQGVARAAPTPVEDATYESESSTTRSYLLAEVRRVCWRDAASTFFRNAPTRPVSLRQTPHAKQFPALTAAPAAPSDATSPPFS